MKRLDQALEALLLSVAKRSGRFVASVVLLFYPGIALALPLAFDWPPPWLIGANAFGGSMAAVVVLTWFRLRLDARDRRNLVEWTTDLRLLDAAEFEWFVGEAFRRDGWQVEETGRHGVPDGNVDLSLRKGGVRHIVQCKRWTSWRVGVDEVRGFAGTLVRERLPMSAGILVTTSRFTEQAREEARATGVTLMDSTDLHTIVERVRRTEPCPTCGSAMHLDRSPRGWWFRCVQHGCAGKRDLGRDPARAVELLTDTPMTGSRT